MAISTALLESVFGIMQMSVGPLPAAAQHAADLVDLAYRLADEPGAGVLFVQRFLAGYRLELGRRNFHGPVPGLGQRNRLLRAI